MDESVSIPSLIVKLVAQCSPEPELGARLKQRLNRELNNLGHPRFDEKQLGHRKFSSYLESTLPSLITVEHPEASGDIKVSLRASRPTSEARNPGSYQGSHLKFRSDIWHAFTNPDPKRLRYFDRESSAVHHFLDTESQKMQPALESKGPAFVEIKRIEGDTQLGWMTGFLDSEVSDDVQRQRLTELLSEGYSSKANSEFTKSLGEHEEQWRRMRTHQITEIIKAWADTSNVDLEQLKQRSTSRVQLKSAQVADEVAKLTISPRQQVEHLLSKMDDSEITAFVIPTLLSHLLAASRI